MKTSEQVKTEIEALQASREKLWDEYIGALEGIQDKLAEYSEQSQTLAELHAELQYVQTKERGRNG